MGADRRTALDGRYPRPILRASIHTKREASMRDLVPGGYLFTHVVFWFVVALVALGTNAVAIILSIGIGVLALESLKKG